MKKLHFLEIGIQPNLLRQEFWQLKISEWHKGAEVQFQVEPKMEELQKAKDTQKFFRDNWKIWNKTADGILVGDDVNEVLLANLPGVSRRQVEIKKIDYLKRDEQQKWWPQCAERDVLHELLTKAAPQLDCGQMAYITGTGLGMRAALSVVVQLGFPIVNIVVMDREEGERVIKAVKRAYFGVDIRLLGSEELTMQKNNGSILINTASHEDTALIGDLSYLNFILAEGLVIDTNLFPLKNHLLEEATNVGLHTLGGLDIQGVTDYVILCSFLPDLKISRKDYTDQWREFIQTKV